MFQVTQEVFEDLVTQGMDAVPERFQQNIKNVAFVTQDVPDQNQRQKLALRHDQSLFGLYEGIPLTKRGAGYNMVLPDKITIFKQPLEWASNSLDELRARVKNTVWHEVAHYFGLDHDRIHELEAKRD